MRKKQQKKAMVGIVADRLVIRMPRAEIVVEKVDDDGYCVCIPLSRGRELFLYGGVDGDISFDLHLRGEDSCSLATFDEVLALINGDHATKTLPLGGK